MIWLVNSVTIFALSACLTAVLIPQILHIATRRKLYDIPNERKIHHYVVPRLGGVAFAPVLFFSCFLLTSANHSLGWDEVYYSIAEESLPIMYTYCAITMLYLVGMADDLNGIHYKTKFMAQTLSALLMIAGGVMLTHIQGNPQTMQLDPKYKSRVTDDPYPGQYPPPVDKHSPDRPHHRIHHQRRQSHRRH